VMPELNDETAQKMGPYESLDALKADLQKFLDQRTEEENNYRAQKAVVEAYVNQAQMELPESLIAREAQVLMGEVQNRFKQQGLNWEQYVDKEGRQNVLDRFRQEASQRLKTSLTFSAYSKDANVEVTQEEYQAEVSHIARLRGADEKAIFRELANNPNAIQAVLDHLVSQKVVERLMQMAEITYVQAPDAPVDILGQEIEAAQGVQTATDLTQDQYDHAHECTDPTHNH
jgi:trigger factor